MSTSTPSLHCIFSGDSRFERRADGQTVFYTSSKRVIGYIIDTPERERCLRAYVRGEIIQLLFVAPLIVPLLMSATYLSGLYPKWTLLFFVAALSIAVAYCVWQSQRLKQRVHGLLKIVAPGYTPRSFWNRPIAIASIVLLALLIATYVSYRPETSRSLPLNAVAFYDDITFPLFGAALFGYALIVIFANRQAIIRERGDWKYRWTVLLLWLFVLISAGWSLEIYLTPGPSILITSTTLSCKPLQLPWSAISDIRLASNGRWSEDVVLTLDPVQESTLPLRPADIERGIVSCTITGNTVGYRVIYAKIYQTWQEARARS